MLDQQEYYILYKKQLHLYMSCNPYTLHIPFIGVRVSLFMFKKKDVQNINWIADYSFKICNIIYYFYV